MNLQPAMIVLPLQALGERDGFIMVTFVANPAGFGDYLKNTAITGKFRERKSW